MKTIALFMIALLATQTAYGQDRTTKLTAYDEFKPSTITLTDGRKLKEKFTNIFLKNSSLLYMSGTVTKEASTANIQSVEFDDRFYVKIDSLLAYQVDTIGGDALFRATIIDQVAYRQNLKNNQVLTNISLSSQMTTTSIDLNNENDFLFPLIDIYYYRLNGKYVRCHDRPLGHALSKEKKRILRTFVHMDDFSWSDEKSLMELLKRLQ